ncbi:MAG: hypothetical protein BWX70_02777 [Verrucomicrobia bacterium ADurb.Bin070]|nr:MAG: hypothetical protein BWX70_02777 [Verrucomicrobia bacterium ADurb.Bin070]
MDDEEGVGAVDERLADIPKELQLAFVDILKVAVEGAHRNVIPLCRPCLSVIVRVFEDVVAERVDASVDAFVFAFDLFHAVGVVIVEAIDPAVRRFEEHGIRRLGAVGRLNVDRLLPRAAPVGAAHGDDVLAGGTLSAAACGDHAEPGAVVGLDDVRLVGIVVARDGPSVREVARVRHGGRRCRRGGHRVTCSRHHHRHADDLCFHVQYSCHFLSQWS